MANRRLDHVRWRGTTRPYDSARAHEHDRRAGRGRDRRRRAGHLQEIRNEGDYVLPGSLADEIQLARSIV